MSESGDKQGGYSEAIKNMQGVLPTVLTYFLKVIMNPVDFYREMQKTGGFIPPLMFMIIIGIVGGLISAILGIIGMSPAAGIGMAIASVILVPIFIFIFGFIVAAVLFIIWRLMGSKENYETAYRVIAYSSAITPITTVLNIIPYIGGIMGLIWITYLLVTGSVEVHKIAKKTAWIVFGGICLILSLISLSAEYTGRKIVREMGQEMKNFEKMSPEEAGKAVGDFLKGLEKSQND